MCGQDNWIVANCTTPANYFHILRRQLHRDFRKPLILMTPKSLLRHKMAVSKAEEFTTGSSFHRVMWDDAQKGNSDTTLVKDDKIKRVVMCSGKVYYDLLEERDARGIDDVYILRVRAILSLPRPICGSRNWNASKTQKWSGVRKSRKTKAHGPSSSPTSNGSLGRINAKHPRPKVT